MVPSATRPTVTRWSVPRLVFETCGWRKGSHSESLPLAERAITLLK